MPKSKYDRCVTPNLDKILDWARQGATYKDIAAKIGVAYTTFRKYLDQGDRGLEPYVSLSDAFTRACLVADEKVETALFDRACGISYEEIKTEQVVSRATGEVRELVTTTRKYIPPDPTSAMFWLTNRQPERWKYRPEGSQDAQEGGGVVVLAPVMDNPGPPEEPEEGAGDE